MARREEDITFHQGNGQFIVEPIRDGQTGEYLSLTDLDVEDVHYVIASSFDDADVIYEAPDTQISITTWGSTEAIWPERFIDGEDDQGNPIYTIEPPDNDDDVIEIDIRAEDTDGFAPAANEDDPELVHELKITSAGDIGAEADQITVFTGDVLILPSATTDK